jgi:hypothetical protein
VYHKGNLGSYQDYVEHFADIDGYVPQRGDRPHQFRWDGGFPPDDWEEFVEGAERATSEANDAVERWQNG